MRLGVGRVPLQPALRPPTPPHPSAVPWPELAAALADLVTDAATVDDCPVTFDFATAGPLGLVGSAQDSWALVRALHTQLPDLEIVDLCAANGSTGLPVTDAPTAILAATAGELPAGVRTVGTWNADGSLTLRSTLPGSPGTAGRRVIAHPDRLSPTEAERLARLSGRSEQPAARQPEQRAPLGVVLGVTEDGDQVVLDLAESAEGGDGPHGWVVGATGTGKSQLLRRIVVGLADNRSPTDVAFVLVDFKGGAAFDDLAALPHVAGILTNLDDSRDQADVQRLIASLQAEVRRRQHALRRAAVPDLTAYRSHPDREALPHLVVVVDEAAELLGSCPEVLEIFATIGRVGRSLGIHLVLAAQRPEEARMRSLEGALRFRVCLRTLTPADSVAVVRTPAAAALPSAPGWALLAVDGEPRRFRVTPVDAVPAFAGFTRARPVWHPPLPAIAQLPAPKRPPGGADVLPAFLLGLADAPQAQWQGPLSIALTGTAGHLVVIGAPRTGRTSTLRTTAAQLAAVTPPSRLHLYAVSASPALTGLNALPHTGAVVHPADEDLVLDVISTVAEVVASRQRQAGERVRPLHAPADVVLLIDDWPQVRAALPDVEPLVQDIAVAGLGVGVHLVLSAHRWSDLRAALRDCIGSRIELHLPDPLESLLPRNYPRPVADLPGRGVLLAGQFPAGTDLALPMPLQVATLPADAEDIIGQRWSAQPATVQPLRRLPSVATRPLEPSPELMLGIGSSGPVSADLDATDRHLLVVGDPGSGRSTVLAAVIRALSDGSCWLVDPRGSLLNQVSAYRAARTPGQIEELLSDLHRELLGRLNGERRARRLLLVVDDLDVTTAFTSPASWSMIASLLPLARDLRLTVAVARRCGGIARAAYEPFLAAIRDASATGVLLAGVPEEGPIIGGVRCRPGPAGRAVLVRPGQPPRPLQLYADPPQVSRQASGL